MLQTILRRLILFCFLALSSPLVYLVASKSHAETIYGTVVYVYDGDSLLLLNERNHKIRVRLIGIDAPEKGQNYAQQSKQSLTRMCNKRKVAIVSMGFDRYRRVLGRMHCQGLDVNREQIRLGMAWVYQRNYRISQLSSVQANARQQRLGLWQEHNPTPPWVFRRNRQQSKSSPNAHLLDTVKKILLNIIRDFSKSPRHP